MDPFIEIESAGSVGTIIKGTRQFRRPTVGAVYDRAQSYASKHAWFSADKLRAVIDRAYSGKKWEVALIQSFCKIRPAFSMSYWYVRTMRIARMLIGIICVGL